MNEIIYFLFGFDLVANYMDGGIETAIQAYIIDSAIGDACKYDPSVMNPIQLLDEYDGWFNYTTITEEEHKQFLEGINV